MLALYIDLLCDLPIFTGNVFKQSAIDLPARNTSLAVIRQSNVFFEIA